VPRLLGGVRRDQDVVRRFEVGDGQVPRGRVRKLPRETGVPAENGCCHGVRVGMALNRAGRHRISGR
jgi:hypothetical protein